MSGKSVASQKPLTPIDRLMLETTLGHSKAIVLEQIYLELNKDGFFFSASSPGEGKNDLTIYTTNHTKTVYTDYSNPSLTMPLSSLIFNKSLALKIIIIGTFTDNSAAVCQLSGTTAVPYDSCILTKYNIHFADSIFSEPEDEVKYTKPIQS